MTVDIQLQLAAPSAARRFAQRILRMGILFPLVGMAVHIPEPAVAPPSGSGEIVFDLHGNHWVLFRHTLHVLPAQNAVAWQEDPLSSVPPGKWTDLETDIYGKLWLSDGARWIVMDPRNPENGWTEDTPEQADLAWQAHWEIVAYLPSGTHDLSGTVLDGTFYMDWAITGDFGYPSKGITHRQLLAFRPETGWSIAGDYGQPRGYCAVGKLGGMIWTVGGLTPGPEGKHIGTDLTQVFDPASTTMTPGLSLPMPLARPVAFGFGGRLFVMGYPEGKDVPLKCFSIGRNETTWQDEAHGPAGSGSAYGAQMNGQFYVALDHGVLVSFDPVEKTWNEIKQPQPVRSPAVGALGNEIWVLGGRGGETLTQIYHPQSNRWREGPALPRPLAWGCAFNLDGDLYLTGGTAYEGFNNATYRLLPNQ